MVATKKGRKPLNFHMCETVYTAIVMNLSKHKSPRDAIIHFIENSETFKSLQDGKLYDDFINDCLRNTPDKLLDYKEYNEKISKGGTIIDEYTETRFGGKDKPKGFPQLHDLEEIKKDMLEMGHACVEPETQEPFTLDRDIIGSTELFNYLQSHKLLGRSRINDVVNALEFIGAVPLGQVRVTIQETNNTITEAKTIRPSLYIIRNHEKYDGQDKQKTSESWRPILPGEMDPRGKK